MTRFITTTAELGLLSACFAPSIRADSQTKESHLTIYEPLQVQNTVLAPGHYVFTLAAPDRNHAVVNIYNAAGARVGVVIGSQAYRAHIDDKTVFTVSQRGNQPGTLKWFYAGDNFGVEFAVK